MDKKTVLAFVIIGVNSVSKVETISCEIDWAWGWVVGVLKYFLMLNRTGKSMDQSQLDKVEKMLEE